MKEAKGCPFEPTSKIRDISSLVTDKEGIRKAVKTEKKEVKLELEPGKAETHKAEEEPAGK
ncbi:MAG: hypothetical protein DRJ47_10805, partial [Thermoprotei archaeon]